MIQKSSLYNSIEYGPKGPKINVLIETEFTKVIRILLATGQEVKEHKTPFPIVIEIVQGHISFGVTGELMALEKGALLSLQGSITHNLVAKEDSILRLTLSKQDEFKRVQKVGEQS